MDHRSEEHGAAVEQGQELNVLILGVGNILLSDEGAGVRAVERLQERYLLPPGLELVDGGTTGLDLLPLIEGRSHLLIVDAIASRDKRPGSVVRLDLSGSPGFFRQKISPHQLGLSDVFAVAEIEGTLPKHILLLGIVPQELSTGLSLSPAVAASLDAIADRLAAELQGLGLKLEPR
jgi:hydrogenase maturation protease